MKECDSKNTFEIKNLRDKEKSKEELRKRERVSESR